MSNLAIVFALAGVLLAFVIVGFFLWQRRFWTQNKEQTHSSSSPREGVGNKLQESTKDWHPPKTA
jgi:hypothetical protein